MQRWRRGRAPPDRRRAAAAACLPRVPCLWARPCCRVSGCARGLLSNHRLKTAVGVCPSVADPACSSVAHACSAHLPLPLPLLAVPWTNLLAVGFDPSDRRAAAAGRLHLRRWQAAHGALPPPLARFLLQGVSGGCGWLSVRRVAAAGRAFLKICMRPEPPCCCCCPNLPSSPCNAGRPGFMSELERLMAWLLWLRRAPPHSPSEHPSPAAPASSSAQIAAAAGSPWRRYVGLLPQGERSPPLPLAFSDSELPELQEAGMEAAARAHRHKIAALHDRCVLTERAPGSGRGLGRSAARERPARVPAGLAATPDVLAAAHARRLFSSAGTLGALHLAPGGLQDTLWAATIVGSRMFAASLRLPRRQGSAGAGGAGAGPSSSSEALTVLAPWADMANHSQQPNALFYMDARSSSFQLLAVEVRAALGASGRLLLVPPWLGC